MKRPKGMPPSQRRNKGVVQQTLGAALSQHVIKTPSNANVRYHEAGHAVACLALGIGLEYVEIGDMPIPGGISHGRAVPTLTDLEAAGNRDLCDKLAVQALCGQEAEMLFDPTVNYAGKRTPDMLGAQEACAWCLCELVDKEDGKKAFTPESWKAHYPEIKAMTSQAMTKAKSLVRAHWTSIERLAKALIDRPRLLGDEVREIIPEVTNTA